MQADGQPADGWQATCAVFVARKDPHRSVEHHDLCSCTYGSFLTWYRLPAIMRLAGFRSRCTIGDGFLLCMYARPRDASSASSTARRSETACRVQGMVLVRV